MNPTIIVMVAIFRVAIRAITVLALLAAMKNNK